MEKYVIYGMCIIVFSLKLARYEPKRVGAIGVFFFLSFMRMRVRREGSLSTASWSSDRLSTCISPSLTGRIFVKCE